MQTIINQYTPSITIADGVSNSLFLIDKILKELGITSNIYSDQIDERLKHKVKHISTYQDSKENLLLYHYSIYDKEHKNIINFKDKKVLIYHNITPHFYFHKNSMLYTICKDAREQLKKSAKYFIASIADSDYNAQELKFYGFKNIHTIPLLINLNKKSYKLNQNIINRYQNNYNILFVGRIVPNKAQHQLVNLLYILKKELPTINFKLHLIGSISDKDYFTYLKKHIQNLSLTNSVNITQKIDDNKLNTYYYISDIFISLSEHEGFCIPLVESMSYDTITIGYNTTAIATTLPKTSLFNYKTPTKIAQFIKDILNSSTKKEEIIINQREHLKQFSYNNLKAKLQNFLKTINITTDYKHTPIKPTKKTIQIEGPFDSSYSLSIVNLNLAKSLNKYLNTKLYSTEGYGDFKPSKEFLLKDKEAKELYNKTTSLPDITIRNLYPPRTNSLKGYIRAIGPYGWEESSFLPEHIELFNTRLTHIFAMSSYVKDIMKTNGVTTPTIVTALGVEHILNYHPKPFSHKKLNGFILLHISSCFPRKGVDILLSVFKELKEQNLNISLIIKTFPNPHSNIEEQISNLPLDIQKDILLLNKDLPFENINYLYTISNALVAPSRGEGFGLPMAEAMLFNLPVITTAYGGQSDFCTNQTAWLIDFKFQRAKTHFNLFNSYWVEPSKKSLKEQIKILYNLPQNQIKVKTSKAKENILKNYTWDKVAKRVLKAINKPQQKTKYINLAIISTYNTKCGIAQYTKSLIKHFNTKNYTIFANYTTKILNPKDETNVIRCWGDRFDKDNNTLIENLKNYTHILIEFNFAFFSMKNLKDILIKHQDKTITLELHSVQDVKIKGIEASLNSIKEQLLNLNRIIVHNINDLNILKEFGVYKNTTYIPLGIEEFTPNILNRAKLIHKYQIPKKEIISTYGFLLPHKGVLELIKAFKDIKKQLPQTHLLLLNSIYPSPISQDYYHKCQKAIKELNLQNDITFITTYLNREDSLELLTLSSLIVLPYQYTQESSSAAAKDILTTKKPLLCSNQPIFNDIKDIIYTINQNIAQDTINLLKQNSHPKLSLQIKYIKEYNFKNISKRVENSIF